MGDLIFYFVMGFLLFNSWYCFIGIMEKKQQENRTSHFTDEHINTYESVTTTSLRRYIRLGKRDSIDYTVGLVLCLCLAFITYWVYPIDKIKEKEMLVLQERVEECIETKDMDEVDALIEELENKVNKLDIVDKCLFIPSRSTRIHKEKLKAKKNQYREYLFQLYGVKDGWY